MKNNETKNPKTFEDCGGLKPLILVKPPKKTTAKKDTKKTK